MSELTITKFQKYKRLARFGVIVYLIAWVICQSGLMFFLFLSPNPPFSYPNLNGRLGMADFVRIYSCAKLVASQERDKLYDTATQLKVVQSVLHTTEEPEAADSPYTPHMCALLAPLSGLPLINAYWTWLAASCISGLIAMGLILKKERHFDNWSTAVTILAVFGSINSMNVLLTGQTTWYMFLFFSIYIWALNHRNDLAAGVSFAMATIKPQYSILYFFGLLASRRWRALLIFCIAAAVMLGFAAYVLGWHNVIDYPSILSQKGGAEKEWYPRKMCNLRAILSFFMPFGIAYKCAFAVLFLSTPFIYRLWASVRDNAERRRWVFSVTMLLSLTLGPHVNNYDCILVALPAMLTLPSVSPVELWKIKSKPLKIWSFALIAYPSLGWIVGSENYLFLPLNILLTVCGLMHLASPEMKNPA